MQALQTDWLLQRIHAGDSPDDVVEALVAAGWPRQSALDEVEARLRDYLGEHAQANDLPPSLPVPAPVESNGEARLVAGERAVSVLMNLLHPRVVLFGGLLSAEECSELIETARGRLQRSTTLDLDSGADQVHAARTSEGAFFRRGETPLIARLETRIAELLDWPLDHGEGLQVLRYAPGAQYEPHHDWFDPARPGSAATLARGGQRVATLVMYLNTPECGGATVFPETRLEIGATQGNALFFSYDRPHPMTASLHGGAPVRRGEKWIATKWLRAGVHY
ncbi:2OG-Fe(II) oxygenase [Luteimonas sp. e5]